MNRDKLRILLAVFVLVMVSGEVCLEAAGLGFQAGLPPYPNHISNWRQPSADFSAAMNSNSRPFQPRVLEREPKLLRSSFESQSLVFNTQYYKRRGEEYWLVPVGVDQHEYLAHRKQKTTDENFRRELNKGIINPDQREQQDGLGVSIGLPKRVARIVGEGGAGLRVNGYRRITFSGRSQWTDGANSDGYSQSKFPTLNMEQISRFNITGNIGSKISVKVSQDSQTDIPLSNRIEIRYKGDEDDILKSIEAGNTTLSLPNTRFVGYSSRIRGLFGLKAEAQVGSLTLTAIASQEKGTSERTSISPTGEEAAEFVRDWEYADSRIFDLGRPNELRAGDSVLNIFVYEQSNKEDDLETDYAEIHVNPAYPDSFTNERIIGIKVEKVERDQYQFINDPGAPPYIVFTSITSRNRAIGVWMVTKVNRQGVWTVDTVGNIVADTLKLKMIRHNNPQADYQTWDLMWRNCYAIPRGSEMKDLNIKIYEGVPGSESNSSNRTEFQELQNGQTMDYIQILGLDRYNKKDERVPDGRVDERQEVFRPDWGLLIFPRRQPFNNDSTFVDANGVPTQELQKKVSAIYDHEQNEKVVQTSSQYFISMSSGTRSGTIRLNRANIIEGSERIYANGELLQRGTDYRIDYSFGTVTLNSSRATDPNANIEIDFEYAPFLALQKKTLLGMRAEYELNKNFSFGGTVLYKSDKAEERKPRVGEETAKMMVYDLDASLSLEPSFLTDMADALPLVETEAASRLTLSGEVAQSRPNPNVEGVAYVDDFESAVDFISLGNTRTVWQPASPPLELDDAPGDWVRGKLWWHQSRNVVAVDEVYDKEAQPGQGSFQPFRMVFEPAAFELDTTITEDELVIDTISGPHRSWGGVMRYFAGRVDPQRVQLLEVRMKTSDSRGKLHFDFGKISEDINGNDLYDTEDKDGNGAVDDAEDTGLDGVMDADEPNYDPELNPDPSGDNWFYEGEGKCPLPPVQCENWNWVDDPYWFRWLNGTEGNSVDARVLGRPDKERLSPDGFNTSNSYFSYVIDLEADSFLIEGSEKNGWVTYRIPLKDSSGLAGVYGSTPNWNSVSHVRVWYEAAEDQDSTSYIEIADWSFVQMNWADSVAYSPLSARIPEDDRTRFIVSSVSEENADEFTAPPGVEPYENRNTNVTEAQRGLQLEYINLNHYDTCLALKTLPTVYQYSGYRRMEMYVWGDTSMALDPSGRQPIVLLFRLGRDSLNFYEYRSPLYPGWDSRNHVNIDFNELTALKDSLLKEADETDERAADIDGAREPYRVKGLPNLNEIRYFSVGVVNTNPDDTLSGPSARVWLDELRVTEVRRDVGTAGRFSMNGSIADLLTYNFNYQSQDPYFRQVSTATRGGGDNNLGSGKNQTTYNYGVSANLDRFLPRSWSVSIPVSYSYSKSVSTPLLGNNSDILLPEARRLEEQSISETKSFSVSERFSYSGNNILFNAFLNRQSVDFSYRRSFSRSVNRPYSLGENITVGTRFDLGIKNAPTLPLFFWTQPIPIARKAADSKLGLYPHRWNLTANYSRNATINDDKNFNRLSSIDRTLTGRMDVAYNLFQNANMSLTLDTRRDLSDLDEVNWSLSDLRLGTELHYGQSFSAGYDPSLLSWFTSQFSYKANYADDWERSAKTRRSAMSQSWGVTGTFDHIKFLGGESRAGGRRGGRRSNIRGGGERKEEGRPFWDYPLAALRFMTGWIQAPDYTYGRDFTASLPGMLDRPSLEYRFGLTRDGGVEMNPQGRSPSSSEGERYSAASGFSFLGGISTDVKFSRSVSRDLIQQGVRSEQVSTNWPDLSIRINQFRTLPLIKPFVNKFIDIFAPKTSYSRSTRETIDLDNGYRTAYSELVAYQPLLSINFNLFRKLSLSGAYALNEDRVENYNNTNGVLEKVTLSTKKSMSFTAQYSFSAPGGIGLPFFGRVKFNSTVNMQGSVKINSQKSETSDRGKPFVTSTDKSDFTWSLSVKYSFSQEISGGFTTRWQDSKDNYRRRNSHVRELQLWVELRF